MLIIENPCYIQIICTSSDLDKTAEKFKIYMGKIVGGLRSKDTQCLYALIDVEPKLINLKLQKCHKDFLKDYSQMTCPSSDLDKNTCKVSKV